MVPRRAVAAAEAQVQRYQETNEQLGHMLRDAHIQMCVFAEEARQAQHELALARADANAVMARAVHAETAMRRAEAAAKAAKEEHAVEMDRQTRCVVCLDQKRSVVIRPCMHLVVCSTCVGMLPQQTINNKRIKKCPLCNIHITSCVKGVYVP